MQGEVVIVKLNSEQDWRGQKTDDAGPKALSEEFDATAEPSEDGKVPDQTLAALKQQARSAVVDACHSTSSDEQRIDAYKLWHPQFSTQRMEDTSDAVSEAESNISSGGGGGGVDVDGEGEATGPYTAEYTETLRRVDEQAKLVCRVWC